MKSFFNLFLVLSSWMAVTGQPTEAPTAAPTAAPTSAPTATPTLAPTATPTRAPTATPTLAPTATPTRAPTATPTLAPTATPTLAPTATPTLAPTATPTLAPTATPTLAPTATPTLAPTATPTRAPTASPTLAPTRTPTAFPTLFPTTFFENPGYPLCSVCGEDYRVQNRDAAIVVAPYGTYTCGQFEQIGFDGFISQKQCPDVPEITLPSCGCVDLPQDPYCNICGVLGNMTNSSGLVVREGFSTINCSYYKELGARGNIAAEQCDATSASFLAANAQCGCTAAQTGFPACTVCPTNFTLGTPAATFTFEGQGLAPLSCGDYEKAAANGLINAAICSAATKSAIAACGGCVDVPGPFEPCNPCGEQFLSNPSSTAPITLFNATIAITCAEWAKSTRLGFQTPDTCEINVNITKAACGCTAEAPTTAPTATPTGTPTTATPTKTPIEPPSDSPVKPPTDSPVKQPTKAPVEPPPPTASPTKAPVLATAAPTIKAMMVKKVKKVVMPMKKKKIMNLKAIQVV
ncbi:hypothetical protein MHU86_1602 [Fragilaria crotonensis]|nr:hypothetical protein MHU86_1602 [Fragilaria crotonensis]